MEESKTHADQHLDVLLVGGGIMSATLGVLLQELEPGWTIGMVERLDSVAEESSNGWNNAGTGHSALCELNYTPQMEDGSVDISKALNINEQFQVSRQFWAHQVETGVLKEPKSFLNSTPHMSFVWGEKNCAFLESRYKALSTNALFAGMKFSTDRAEIAQWAPQMIEGLDPNEPVAATWAPQGTDVNFGEITRQFATAMSRSGNFSLMCGHEVTDLHRLPDGGWKVSLRDTHTRTRKVISANFVFLGAGGGALPLLQKSGIPEADDYAGFPVGGSFLVCDNPEVVARHNAKVYGKAAVGSPPMSVPHLDKRFLDGREVLLFGPFATFSTRFLKTGSLLDLPKSVTAKNLLPTTQVGATNLDLVKYLVGQLLLTDAARMKALRAYLPAAKDGDWKLWQAGQRVQIIKKEAGKGGTLKLGTEIVACSDRSIAALLGASPGASTAAPIMLELLKKVFPERVEADWQAKLRRIVPSYGHTLHEDAVAAARSWSETSQVLDLPAPPPEIAALAETPETVLRVAAAR
ncbi:malate dehydrogenase (quinone) [Pseudooceanicola sp. CBS1P-1]|uniref:malate dehydrogenase (quinone) n=1 Tax=Pseudooceanicola endophyticus TaxID=2841273 RepID=UPI001C036CB9|nr:malate dehydrogenase (quinone) [Pseudooceanicola endophyticus]MBT9382971.1 malate dehydrogenase (quinone) [Pseudooceanicola endophyticus]